MGAQSKKTASKTTAYVLRPNDPLQRMRLDGALHGVNQGPVDQGPERGVWYVFAVPADRDKLQHLCDEFLNEPQRSPPAKPDRSEYDVCGKHMLLVFGDVQGQLSFGGKGRRASFRYKNAAIWIPVRESSARNRRKNTVAFFPYYAWTWKLAYPLMSLAREVYGWPLAPAGVRCANDSNGPDGSFSVDTSLLQRFSRNARAELGRLITLTTGTTVTQSEWQKGAEQVIKDLCMLEDGSLDGDLEHALRKGSATVRFLLLKQFRDSMHPRRACYQEVVECRVTIEPDGEPFSSLLNEHDLTIMPADSHPLVRELGLASHQIGEIYGVKLRLRIRHDLD